jgi:hypothetical protein
VTKVEGVTARANAKFETDIVGEKIRILKSNNNNLKPSQVRIIIL